MCIQFHKKHERSCTMIWVITRQKLEMSLCIFLLLCACIFAVYDGKGMKSEISAVSSTGVRELPIYSVETEEKRLALSFDAADGAEDLDALLGVLSSHDVKATFFLCGCWIRNHSRDAVKIMNAGHEIGNHGDMHLDPVKLSKEELMIEIENQAAEIQKLFGIQPTLYRPAYGSYNTEVIRTAKNMGYEAIQWSVDSLDWKNYGVEEIQSQILSHSQLKNGAILLFHVDTKYTVQALDGILTELEKQGYEIGTVSDLIWVEPYEIDHTGRQFKGSSMESSAASKD